MATNGNLKWNEGISRYQWLVLLVASLGWVFDVFEGQIFVASMREAMPSLLPEGTTEGTVDALNRVAMASFLVGGALGGVLFGALSDRIGRTKTMIITILFYSLFTCVTALAQSPWQMIVLRFFVAMGVGGEWAVASAMVSEVMPKRSRAHMGSIFHASSVFGTLLAAAAGAFIVGNAALGWRWGFLIGVLPALLTVWIRWKLKEPEAWTKAKEARDRGEAPPAGRIRDLFAPRHRRNTLVGVSLAAVGLATFWGVHIYGKNALLEKSKADFLVIEQVAIDASPEVKKAALEKHAPAIKNAEMLSMALNTIGGGLGLVLFGAISQRIGRKGAFYFYHIGAFLIALVMFQVIIGSDLPKICYMIVLPIFGFLTLGMHAGYAIYFPELYPTRLRGTGAGFCFNMARLVTAAMILLTGWMRATGDDGLGFSLTKTATILSVLFLIGIPIIAMAKETRDTELPEEG